MTVDSYAALLGILGALLIGAMSPGPSFVLVSHISITSSRRHGLAAALGMGVGGTLFSALALAGLSAILLQMEWLYMVLKVLGGCYLGYIAISIWRGAQEPIIVSEAELFSNGSLRKAFATALITQISNPKAAIVYGSIFAALMPASPELWMVLMLPPLVFLLETGWYCVVAVAFSSRATRGVYLHSKKWIDRFAAAIMGALGARLVFEGLKLQKTI
jgi:threonine/homoserine/homoserine lactone efflux protein